MIFLVFYVFWNACIYNLHLLHMFCILRFQKFFSAISERHKYWRSGRTFEPLFWNGGLQHWDSQESMWKCCWPLLVDESCGSIFFPSTKKYYLWRYVCLSVKDTLCSSSSPVCAWGFNLWETSSALFMVVICLEIYYLEHCTSTIKYISNILPLVHWSCQNYKRDGVVLSLRTPTGWG